MVMKSLLLSLVKCNTILSEPALNRLRSHVYKSEGSTFLDKYMQVFWNRFVRLLPMWWAPNCMTLVGLACNIITTLILVYFSPDAKRDIPRWALVLCAVGLFVYQTLDACDGKQARRTNSSSPLGELFDHGCDAISTIFVALTVCEAVQLGHYPNWMLFQCMAATTLFYAAHWQTYVSGSLKFGKFDVTEAQFTIIAVLLISALFGTHIWEYKLQLFLISVELKIILLVGSSFGAFHALYEYIIIIFTGGKGRNGSSVAIPWLHVELKIIPVLIAIINEIFVVYCYAVTILSGGVGKNGSTVADTSVLSPFTPIFLVDAAALVIYMKSPSSYENYLCLYIITFGLVTAKITCKLVVAHMSRSEIEKFDPVLIGPLMLFFNHYFNTILNEYFLLWVALIITLANFCVYSTTICTQIATFLRIKILSIDPSAKSSEPIKPGNLLTTANDIKQSESVVLLLGDELEEDSNQELDVLYHKNHVNERV